jgi:RsiW-degrading membrane proteinase PrsW (M82 family)
MARPPLEEVRAIGTIQTLSPTDAQAVIDRLSEPGPLARRWVAFVERHAVLLGRLRRIWVAWSWLSILLFVMALVLVPSLRTGIPPALWCYVILVQLFLLARTKTLPWRMAAVCFVGACVIAPLIGLVDVAVAGLIGADIDAQDGAVLVAGPVEEVGKLVPVVVLMVVWRRRAEMLSACDVLLLGAITGLGFQAVEDTMRQLASTLSAGGLAELLRLLVGEDSGAAQYGFGLLPGWAEADGVWFTGHYVGTAIVAAGIALAMRGRRAPVLRWLVVGGLLVMVVLDHALYNFAVTMGGNLDLPNRVDLPDWLVSAHALWGYGALQRPLLLVLLVLCIVADVRRTRLAAPYLPELPRVGPAAALDRWARQLLSRQPPARTVAPPPPPPPPAGWGGDPGGTAPTPPPTAAAPAGPSTQPAGSPAPTREAPTPPVAAIAWLAFAAADVLHELALAVMVLGSGARDPDADDERALPLLHRLALALRSMRIRRALSQGLGRHIERVRSGRHRPGPAVAPAATAAAVTLVAVLVLGLVASDTGGGAVGEPAPGFLANLFEELGQWWDGLGLGGQIAVVLGIAALLSLFGGFALLPALGWATAATSVAAYGRGIGTFIRDPEQATRSFLANLTPGQILGYLGEAILGRVLPAGVGAALGRRLRGLYDFERRYPGYIRRRGDWYGPRDRGSIRLRTFREDDYLRSPTLPDGLPKPYINEAGDFMPPNPEGKVDLARHIAEGKRMNTRKNNPFISFYEGERPRFHYGRNVIELDRPRLEADIRAGRVQGVEVFDQPAIQAALRNEVAGLLPQGVNVDRVVRRATATASNNEVARYAATFKNRMTPNDFNRFRTVMQAINYNKAQQEVLVRGVLPQRYFRIVVGP